MNRIINFFLVGIKYFFKALFVGIFAIFIAGLFIIFIQELFWLLGYFVFKDFAALVFDVPTKPFTSLKIDDPDLKIDDDPFLAIGADIIFAILALIIYILYFIFFFLIFILYILVELPGSETHPGDLTPFIVVVVPVITLIIFIFILIIFAKITMKFLNDFKNKTYSKSF
ncbi:MAG: hypothetical protein SPF98_05975, partial [Campylobacter sp.]|nr:hypothetical protein [Campylobacter sp.]